MKKMGSLLFVISMIFCSSFHALAQAEKKSAQSDIHGYWANDSKTIIIKMYDNEKGQTRGKVVWLRDSIDALGNDRRDVRNSNINLRSRKIIGMDILYAYKYDAKDHEWESGTIYNFDNGTEYHGKMWIDKEDNLYIKGYWWWFWFLSKTKYWERIQFTPPTQNTVKK
jgi:uncharacterized protein (DUF2147 family)